MKLKLIKEQSVNFETGSTETWFFIYNDDKLLATLKDEFKAKKVYDSLERFLATHGTYPFRETLFEKEVRQTLTGFDSNTIDDILNRDN